MKRALSSRERQVLELIHLSNKEIGRKLGITEATVKVHVKAILSVLGVHKRAEAALIAERTMKSPTGLLLEALQAIAAHRPYPSLIASRALKDYGESL